MPHTKTPWRREEDFDKHWISSGRASRKAEIAIVCNVEEEDDDGDMVVDEETTLSNAERIVVCVNACEGISDEVLNSGALKKLMKAAYAMYFQD